MSPGLPDGRRGRGAGCLYVWTHGALCLLYAGRPRPPPARARRRYLPYISRMRRHTCPGQPVFPHRPCRRVRSPPPPCSPPCLRGAAPGVQGNPGCRPAVYRYLGRPCWWLWSRCRIYRPGPLSAPPGRGVWHLAPHALSPAYPAYGKAFRSFRRIWFQRG